MEFAFRILHSKYGAVALDGDGGCAAVGPPVFGDAATGGPGAAFQDFDQGEFFRGFV